MTYIKFVLINKLEKGHSMIETRPLKNVVIFIQAILSFVLLVKIGNWIVLFFKEKITPKHLKIIRSSEPRVRL